MANRFKMEGDIRLREQQDFYADSNAPAANFQAIGQAIDNTTEDQLRGRLRMRLGINANVTQGIDMGMRLATGNINGAGVTGDLLGDGSPTSTLQTLGTYASKFSFVLDQAYLKLTRWDWFTASGGRFPNPYFVGTVGNIYTGIVKRPPYHSYGRGRSHRSALGRGFELRRGRAQHSSLDQGKQDRSSHFSTLEYILCNRLIKARPSRPRINGFMEFKREWSGLRRIVT